MTSNRRVNREPLTGVQIRIAVMASASAAETADVVKLCRDLGRAVAEAGCCFLTGACPGLPHEAVLGAKASSSAFLRGRVGITDGLADLVATLRKVRAPRSYTTTSPPALSAVCSDVTKRVTTSAHANRRSRTCDDVDAKPRRNGRGTCACHHNICVARRTVKYRLPHESPLPRDARRSASS